MNEENSLGNRHGFWHLMYNEKFIKGERSITRIVLGAKCIYNNGNIINYCEDYFHRDGELMKIFYL